MTSDIQAELLSNFLAIAGRPDVDARSAAENLAAALQDAVTRSENPSGGAKAKDSAAGSAGGSGWANALMGGLGILPVVGGLLGLFGSDDQPEPITKYLLPARLQIETARTADGLTGVDYDQRGMARAFGGRGESSAGLEGAGAANQSQPQITVNVQAMDARSFLDRSTDIAAAVRNAMLNLSSINDVVNEL